MRKNDTTAKKPKHQVKKCEIILDCPRAPAPFPEELKYTRTNKFGFDRHLKDPLEWTKIDFLRRYPDVARKHRPSVDTSYYKEFHNGVVHGERLISTIIDVIENRHTIRDYERNVSLDEIINMTVDTLSLHVRGFAIEGVLPNLDRVDNISRQLRASDTLKSSHITKVVVLAIHENLKMISNREQFPAVLSVLPCVEIHSDLVVVRGGFPSPIAIPFSHFLAALDIIESRFLVSVYCSMAESVPGLMGTEFSTLYQRVSEWQERTYLLLGNLSHAVFKNMEAIILGVYLEWEQEGVQDTNLLTATLTGLREKDIRYEERAKLLARIVHDHLVVHQDKGVPGILEMYGMEKARSSPTVDIRDGIWKMREYANSYRSVDLDMVRELMGFTNREMIMALARKKRKLPKVVMHDLLDSRVRTMLEKGELASDRECYSIPSAAWASLTFKKNEEFNYFLDPLDLIDDKSISPQTHNLNQCYAREVIDGLSLDAVLHKDKDDVQLISKLLNTTHIDIASYFHQVETLGAIPVPWRLIRLKGKEGEEKLAVRPFSILTFECRMMASTVERNISDKIMPLFKSHSMSASGPELRGIIENFYSLPEESGKTWVYIHMDLEQWNYTFRNSLVSPFCHLFNTLFGVEHFGLALKIFRDAIFVAADKWMHPEEEGVWCSWVGTSGGNQGICQKLWTFITMMVIKMTLVSDGIPHVMTGAGDNQVAAVMVRDGPLLGNRVRAIIDSLRGNFERVGLTLKAEETWFSSTLLTYQRKYYYKGTQCPLGIKTVMRAASGGGDLTSGLEGVVSTAMGAGLNLASVITCPLVAMTVSYMEAYTSLLAVDPYKLTAFLPSSAMAAWTLAGSEISGLPFLTISNFLFSGHQDPISDSLGMMSNVWNKDPGRREDLAWLLGMEPGPSDESVELSLIQNPLSLNQRRAPSSSSIIRREVEEKLSSGDWVSNVKLREFFSALDPQATYSAAAELMKIKPIHLSLLHTLFESSQWGHVASVVGKFNRLSSIGMMVNYARQANDRVSIQAQIYEVDKIFVADVRTRYLLGAPTDSSFISAVLNQETEEFHEFCMEHQFHPECLFSLRLYLVPYTFHKGVELIKGPFVAPPQCQFRLEQGCISHLLPHSVRVVPDSRIPMNYRDLETTRGPFRSYHGSTTANPIKTVKLTHLQGIESGKAINNMVQMYSWLQSMGCSKSIGLLIENMVGTRCLPLSLILPLLARGTMGGTFTHRGHPAGIPTGCYTVGPSLVSTWLRMSTNGAEMLQRGEEDRYIYFQQAYQYIIGSSRLSSIASDPFLLVIHMDHCSYPVGDGAFDGEVDSDQITISGGCQTAVPTELEEGLIEEMLNVVELISDYPSNHIDHKLLLSGCVAEKAGRIASSSLTRTDQVDYSRLSGEGPQSDFNITHLRLSPLPALLASLSLQLCIKKAQDYHGSLSSLREQLLSRLATPSSTIDARGFSSLISSIVTAGLLPDLVTLSKLSSPVDHSSLHIHLLPLLIKAMVRSLKMVEEKRLTVVVVYVTTDPKGKWPGLWRAASHWSEVFKRWHKLHPNASNLEKMSAFSMSDTTIELVISHSWDMLTQEARIRIKEARATHKPSSPATQLQLTPWDQAPATMSGGAVLVADQVKLDIPLNPLEQYWWWTRSAPDWIRNVHRISRWNRGCSGGRDKLRQCLSMTGIPMVGYERIMSLAEGSGSFLSVLLHACPEANGIYNSLMNPSDLPHCFDGTYIPPDCLCVHEVHKRISNIPYMPSMRGDLMEKATWSDLVNYAEDWKNLRWILTMDAEGWEAGRRKIETLLGHFISGSRPDTFVIKFFLASDPLGGAHESILSLSSYYDLNLCKPPSSSICSSEVYLVGSLRSSIRPPIPLSHWTQSIHMLNTKVSSSTDCDLWDQAVSDALDNRSLQLCPTSSPCKGSGVEIHPGAVHSLISRLIVVMIPLCRAFGAPRLTLSKADSSMMLGGTQGTSALRDWVNTVWSVLLWWVQVVVFHDLDFPRCKVSKWSVDGGLLSEEMLSSIKQHLRIGDQIRKELRGKRLREEPDLDPVDAMFMEATNHVSKGLKDSEAYHTRLAMRMIGEIVSCHYSGLSLELRGGLDLIMAMMPLSRLSVGVDYPSIVAKVLSIHPSSSFDPHLVSFLFLVMEDSYVSVIISQMLKIVEEMLHCDNLTVSVEPREADLSLRSIICLPSPSYARSTQVTILLLSSPNAHIDLSTLGHHYIVLCRHDIRKFIKDGHQLSFRWLKKLSSPLRIYLIR